MRLRERAPDRFRHAAQGKGPRCGIDRLLRDDGFGISQNGIPGLLQQKRRIAFRANGDEVCVPVIFRFDLAIEGIMRCTVEPAVSPRNGSCFHLQVAGLTKQTERVMCDEVTPFPLQPDIAPPHVP